MLSSMIGLSNRAGRFPLMRSERISKLVFSCPKGMVLKNVCASPIKHIN